MKRIIGVIVAAFPAAAVLAQGPAAPLPRELGAFAVEARQAPQSQQTPAPDERGLMQATQLERNNPPQASEDLRVIEVENADMRLLLSKLVQSYGLNLVMSPDINAKVSINLQDATLGDALETILTPLDLRYRVDGKLLRVSKPEMVSRTMKFNYVDVSRNLSRSLSASAQAGFSGGGLAGTGGGSLSGGSSTSISGTQSTDVMKELDLLLGKLKSDRGSVNLFKMTGTIFATDFPKNLEAMEVFLETLQNTVNKQVLIEAKLIEVQLNQNSQMGVNWTTILGNTLTFGAGLGQQSAVQIGVAHNDFNAIISALATQGKVTVRSSPVIITMNGQPAVIRVGNQDVFFITTTQLDPRTGQVLQSSTVPATVNEGVVLDVTPTISDDGIIMMNIHPTVTQRTGQVVSPQGNTAPVTSVQEADTMVRLPDGEMIAIAGLITERTSKQEKRVPVLSGIPGIGKMFRGNADEQTKTDLAILMSARILNLPGIVDYSKKKAEELDRATRTETLKQDLWK